MSREVPWLCRECEQPVQRTDFGWGHVGAAAADGHTPRPQGAEFYVIRVNDADVVLDGGAFLDGKFLVASFSSSEQCGDCGQNIEEAGHVVRGHGHVRCACGAVYNAKPGRMVDGWVRNLE
jgi:hypothetical protein